MRKGRRSHRRYSQRRQSAPRAPKAVPYWKWLLHWVKALFVRKPKVLGQVIPFDKYPEPDLEFIPPLFSRFPELLGRIPWVSLRGTQDPSVPKKISRAQHYFGSNHTYLKRESRDVDLISETSAKKLEFILGRALQTNPTKIYVFDSSSSSHLLALSQAASLLKKKIAFFLLDDGANSPSDTDLRSIQELGAKIKYFRSAFFWNLWKKVLQIFDSKHSVFLPLEDSEVLSALAYVSSLVEIETFHSKGQMPIPDFVFVPVETGAVIAGMEVARRVLGLSQLTLIGISTHDRDEASPERLAEICNQTIELLNENLGTPVKERVKAQDFIIIDSSPKNRDLEEMQRWTSRFLELEGVELDIHSTAPAIFESAKYLEREKIENRVVLFWKTYSGSRTFDLGTGHVVEIDYGVRRQKRFSRSPQ